MRPAKGFLMLFSIWASLLILFIVLPLSFLLLVGSRGFIEIAFDEGAWRSILLSLEAGALAATISTAFAVPLAYLMARVEFRGKEVLASILDLPIVIPHTVAGIAIILAFSSRSPLGSALGLGLEDTFWGVVAAMAFVSSPFPVNFAREAFESIDISLEQVARTLGAGQFKTFLLISLPLALRGILTGWAMALARAMSEVGAIMVVAYHPIVSSVLVYEWYTTRGVYAAAGLSVLLLMASLLVLVGIRALRRRGR